MDTIAGVFNSQAEAEQVLNQLNRLNLEADRLRVLHQGTVEESRSLLTPFAVALTPGGDELSSAHYEIAVNPINLEALDA